MAIRRASRGWSCRPRWAESAKNSPAQRERSRRGPGRAWRFARLRPSTAATPHQAGPFADQIPRRRAGEREGARAGSRTRAFAEAWGLAPPLAAAPPRRNRPADAGEIDREPVGRSARARYPRSPRTPGSVRTRARAEPDPPGLHFLARLPAAGRLRSRASSRPSTPPFDLLAEGAAVGGTSDALSITTPDFPAGRRSASRSRSIAGRPAAASRATGTSLSPAIFRRLHLSMVWLAVGGERGRVGTTWWAEPSPARPLHVGRCRLRPTASRVMRVKSNAAGPDSASSAILRSCRSAGPPCP
jgi:hypothetical protein